MTRTVTTIAFLVPALAMLAACNDPGFAGVTGVREVTEAEVAACAYDADLTAKPGVFGPVVGQQALAYARNQVLDLAKSSGANTVVFEPAPPGQTVYVVRARSYRC